MKTIVVVGGGIGGLAFAAAAGSAGFDVTVLERAPRVVRTNAGGGLGLWPPAQQVLARIGVLDELRSRGRDMPSPAYCDRHGRVLAAPSHEFPTRFPILCVERAVLLEVLAARCTAEGVDIVTDATVTGLSVGDQRVEVDVDGAARRAPLRADVVVGADGIHSRVRSTLLAGDARPAPRHCGYAYFRSSTPVAKRVPTLPWHAGTFEIWAQGIRFGYVPMKEPSVFWFAAVPIGHRGLDRRDGAHRLEEHDKAWLRALLQGWRSPRLGPAPGRQLDIAELVRLTDADSILRTDIYKLPGVTRFAWRNAPGNVVLLGDACHATAPNLAQGAGLSIEDGAELAFQLDRACRASRRARGDEEAHHAAWRRELRAAIDRYETARKPRARTVQTLADAIAIAGQLRAPFASLRDAAMKLSVALLPGTTARVFESVVARSTGGGRRRVTWEHPGVRVPVVEAVMGTTAFERAVPIAAQDFRRRAAGGYGTGRVTVECGTGWLPRLIAAVAGLPPGMTDQPFEAAVTPIDCYRERWIRRFGGVAYATTMSRVRHFRRRGGATGLVLTEGVGGVFDGLIRFGYRASDAAERVDGGDDDARAVAFRSVGLWLGDRVRLPLPGWLQPRSSWVEQAPVAEAAARDICSGWRFDGRIELPRLLGGQLLMAYRGTFVPEGRVAGDSPSADAGTEDERHAIVCGGTGFLGHAVCAELLAQGWYVTVPTRRPRSAHDATFDCPRYEEVSWNPRDADAAAATLRAAIAAQSACRRVVVINLAGENPGTRRWSARTMQTIVDSRLAVIRAIEALQALLRADIEAGRMPVTAYPAAVLQASAVGIYSDRGTARLADLDEPGVGSVDPGTGDGEARQDGADTPWRTIADPVTRGRSFRVACCRQLEAAAAALAVPVNAADGMSPRVANLRIGMVLGHGSGLLPHLQRAARLGASRLGSGTQQVAWIHIGDAARVIAMIADRPEQLADHDASSFAVNVCAPAPVTGAALLAAVRAAQRASGELGVFSPSARIPVPAAAIALAAGPAASVVLDSQAAVPARLRARLSPEAWHELFRYPDIDDALMSWACAVSSR